MPLYVTTYCICSTILSLHIPPFTWVEAQCQPSYKANWSKESQGSCSTKQWLCRTWIWTPNRLINKQKPYPLDYALPVKV